MASLVAEGRPGRGQEAVEAKERLAGLLNWYVCLAMERT